MPTYIYALLCPQGEIRYIGKTNNPQLRLSQHMKTAASGKVKHYTANWIRSLLAAGQKPHMEIVQEVPEGESWEEYEIRAIAEFRAEGHRLTNSTPGGNLMDVSPEAIAKRVALGTVVLNTPEIREKMSLGVKRTWNDPEIAERRKSAMRLAFATPECFEKRSISSKRFADTPGEREKRSERAKKNFAKSGIAAYRETREYKERWTDPELRAKRLENFYATGHLEKLQAGITPEVRKRQGQTFKEKHEDPEFRAKMAATKIEINARPEVKAAKTEKSKANWANPEYVARHAASMEKVRQDQRDFLATPEGQKVVEERKAAKKARDIAYGRAKRAERKAERLATLAATASAPYTESP